jgi:hypothetical protein
MIRRNPPSYRLQQVNQRWRFLNTSNGFPLNDRGRVDKINGFLRNDSEGASLAPLQTGHRT